MLLKVLLKNAEVFKGGQGYYNGEPVGIKLKPDAKPFRAKPYPIALKNREVMEHELERQCSIGCLGRLTPEEFEGSGPENDIFSSSPKIIFECSNLLY
jgi:hypothetical protein